MSSISGRGVVVGVDETLASRAALAVAMSEAALRGTTLDIITAWRTSTPEDGLGADGGAERAREQAQLIQDNAVATTLMQIAARPVLTRQVIEGHAGEVLTRVATDAAYLVVGMVISGRLPHGPIGSVSEYCLRHANCPVMMVPAEQPEGRDREAA